MASKKTPSKNNKEIKVNKEENLIKNNKNALVMKILVFLGVVISLGICFYLMNYFFVERSYIKINMSTDKRIDNITVYGKEVAISTQKYVSDLSYNMRYDVDEFRVFKYKAQDIFKYKEAEKVLVVVERGTVPSNCSTPADNVFNSCKITVDYYTSEYYVSHNDKTYKITVKTPGENDYKDEVKARINYMLNSFEIV